MDSSTFYFCCRCSEIESLAEAYKVFQTGFTRVEGQDYLVGYCKWSEFYLSACKALDEEQGGGLPITENERRNYIKKARDTMA
ncbi:hypothetical protein [Paenibacillus mucilaginosus]|uniref:hypothetical protein n=1 Tax=Paenibacillus mucilaginosus TaxID=61624 RepID=UPI0016511182|nr:hypothetical protein [Paenibacillus mucilaginosus]MCG7217771.1 hypothetical protein [Paenibacillus mucilaginosus]WDM28986.1 hypothetical protein KCX80_07375 [Paenibacillus mucilaginosus]